MPGEGGLLITAAVVLPLLGAVSCFLFPGKARLLALAVAAAVLVDAAVLARVLMESGPALQAVGGWPPPLGIELRADGLSAFMLLTTAFAGLAATVYAAGYVAREPDNPAGFWPLWLFLWAALNALFLSADVFNLYVTLELLGLAAVCLVATAGGADALGGAMRYLLATMLASLTYLLGVALLYHQSGTLDMTLLGGRLESSGSVWVALGLMVAALIVKSAIFPVHFWLPPAHSSAPAPVSAVLSGLVVEATVYLLLRLWLDVMPGGRSGLGAALAALGASAIIWGSIQALRQAELKLLVAYSTVAQLGYLLLPFAVRSPELAAVAWRGALYFLLSHALAKAAMFMAVGNLTKLAGGGRLSDLRQVAQQRPVTLAAFGVAGVTVIGLPPSGGFLGKWLLLEGTLGDRRWAMAGVILLGGLLAAAYVFKVVGLAFVEPRSTGPRPASHPLEWVTLIVALGTVALGFLAPPFLALLAVGGPFRGAAP